MPTSPNRFSGYSASVFSGSAGGTETDFVQLSGHAVDGAQRHNEIYVSGLVDRQATMIQSAPATIRLTSQDLATILDVVDPAVGLNCTGGAIVYFQKRTDGGVFAGAGANVVGTSALGFLQPERLHASGDNPAMIELLYHALSSDGITAPFVQTASQNLGGTAPSFVSQYFLGGCYLGSTSLPGLCDARIDFGIQFSKFTTRGAPDGCIYPVSGTIIKRQPIITLGFTDVSLHPVKLASLFENTLGSSLYVYFAKGVAGGSRYAYNAGDHVKVSTTAGSWSARQVSVSGESDAEISIEVRPSASVIGLSLASTIP